ncbi:molybdopterin-dependent oxidoreductase [Dyadobacter pollutisoli]|uniref:Molybdopterin-dependent oxidoreductase n=1 Tax=Dyadobacter pollutisoli TaxID=2910158 RepID=A0A9E8NGU8_9BACT|nr:molybdopterin-dependent oxidoreductase [Dyadobacter pollutisoli]WAC14721.1 molybdopterin-dependent oxidoreductase [Dyadobacter pollutisoli]
MKKDNLITRRSAIITGISSLGALLLNGCSETSPPTYGNILRMGDMLTYHAHRALLPGQSLVKEYSFRDISSFPATGTTNPGDTSHPGFNEDYARFQKDAFSNWDLKVEGRVKKPGTYSIADLQRFPVKKQITRHTCEEGWTAIAEWAGVPLSLVLQNAGILPSARYVNFFAYDGFIDGIDLLDAFHPQTILAYGMNGRNLPIAHGAPLRLRLETQIGYKSMKYLQKIVVTDEFLDQGDYGWAWYTGI